MALTNNGIFHPYGEAHHTKGLLRILPGPLLRAVRVAVGVEKFKIPGAITPDERTVDACKCRLEIDSQENY